MVGWIVAALLYLLGAALMAGVTARTFPESHRLWWVTTAMIWPVLLLLML